MRCLSDLKGIVFDLDNDMTKIINEFAVPLGKHDTQKAREAKQRIFRSTFNTYQRHAYSDIVEQYKDDMYEKFKSADIDNMAEFSQLVSNQIMNDHYGRFEQHIQELWLSKLKNSLRKMDVSSTDINYFIVPMLYDGINEYQLGIMLCIAELYHDLKTALNAMLLSIEYVNTAIEYGNIELYIQKFKRVMGNYHALNMVELLNPMESPLMVKPSRHEIGDMDCSYSGTLYFINQLSDMLDYVGFANIIDSYTEGRHGIDIESIRETVEVRKFFIQYFNTSTRKQQRNFISCLVKYYDKTDKEYVIRKNKLWLRKIIKELDETVQQDIHNTVKLLNLSI